MKLTKEMKERFTTPQVTSLTKAKNSIKSKGLAVKNKVIQKSSRTNTPNIKRIG